MGGGTDDVNNGRIRPSSALIALGGMAGRGVLALLTSTKEDPGALAMPPKQAAMSLGTAEDDHEGDVVLHVAPEHIKENQRPERARKRNLEELQADYIKMRKKNRAAESTNKALQDLCAKQRLELDAARDEASQAGRLSATVCQLELEMRAWKASHDPDSIKDLQKLLAATEENAVARMTALNRKAVAAQEVAQSAQQQLSHSAAQHDQQLAELQQQLNASLQNVACLQQENTAAGSLHLKEMADLQAHHAQMLTDMESAFKTRMGSCDSDHAATIRDLQAQMASAAQQHRQTMAEVEVHYKRQLAAQRNIHLAKSTEASELSKVEVVSVRGYWKQQLAAAEKQCTDALQTAEAAHAAELTQLRATVQKQCTDTLETAEVAHSAELTQLRAELATVQKQWADGADFDWAGTIDNEAAHSKQHAAAKQCTLLQFSSLTTTTETSSAAVDTIPAVKMGATTSDKLQHQQQLSTDDPWSDSLSSSNVQLQSDAEVDVKPSNSSGSDTSSDTSKGPAQQSLQKNAFGSELIASNSCAQQDAEGDTCTSIGNLGEQQQEVAASGIDPGLSTGNTLTEPMHDVANTADTAVASQASSLGKTADTAVEAQTSSDNMTAPAQADSVKVAVPVQASSTDQTMPAQAGGVKKTVPDEANTVTSCTQPKAVGAPVQESVTPLDSETTKLTDSSSTLFSSPWDEAAAAAEIDMGDDVVDYEQLWIKGPQSWCDLDDDWGIDEYE